MMMMKKVGEPVTVSATRVLRKMGPPLSSVLIRLEWDSDEVSAESLRVWLDGQQLTTGLFEVTRIDQRELLLIIRGEAFPWLTSENSCSRLELYLEDQPVLTDNIEVDGFQAA